MKKLSILQNCKNQLENAFNLFIETNGTTDKVSIYTYLNDVQDSIIKDLHPSIKDSRKDEICNSLANFNIRLRKRI
jgi:hypothetical protein